MSLEILRNTLGWCALINTALLLLWWLLFVTAHDWIYRLQSRWITIPVERFDAIHYAAMAGFKLAMIFLNLTPYLALSLAS